METSRKKKDGKSAHHDFDIFVKFNWVCHPVTAVQYTFTHKQFTEQHNETECPE
jgi:hypothetical protein